MIRSEALYLQGIGDVRHLEESGASAGGCSMTCEAEKLFLISPKIGGVYGKIMTK